jgi:hypothetical protein
MNYDPNILMKLMEGVLPPEIVEIYMSKATELPETKWSVPLGVPPYDYEVKSWPWFFEPMVAKKKTHDMRDMRDRSYKIGDRMLLREFDPRDGKYTGRCALATITYITSTDTPCAMSSATLDKNFAILSVSVIGPYEYDRLA